MFHTQIAWSAAVFMPSAIKEKSIEEKPSEGAIASSDSLASDATSTRRLSPKKVLIKLLYNPLTWLAIGAHVLLLLVPFDPSVKTAEVIEEPEAEEDESIPVDILNLSALSRPEPPETPPPTEPPPPTSVPVDVPPPPAVPIPSESPVSPAASTDPPPAFDPSTPPDPTDPPEPTPPPYNANGDRTQFLSNLDGLQGLSSYRGTANELPAALNFGRKGHGSYFLDFSNPNVTVPLANSLDAIWYKDSQVADVVQTMRNSYEPYDYQLLQVDDYAQEELYELIEPEGNTVMFVSAVNFPGSVLLVMWPDNPNGQ